MISFPENKQKMQSIALQLDRHSLKGFRTLGLVWVTVLMDFKLNCVCVCPPRTTDKDKRNFCSGRLSMEVSKFAPFSLSLSLYASFQSIGKSVTSFKATSSSRFVPRSTSHLERHKFRMPNEDKRERERKSKGESGQNVFVVSKHRFLCSKVTGVHWFEKFVSNFLVNCLHCILNLLSHNSGRLIGKLDWKIENFRWKVVSPTWLSGQPRWDQGVQSAWD